MRPLCQAARALTRTQKRTTSATEKRRYLFVDEMSDPPARMAWPGDGGLGCVDSGSADWLSCAVSFIGFASVLVLKWSDAGGRPENAQGLGCRLTEEAIHGTTQLAFISLSSDGENEGMRT